MYNLLTMESPILSIHWTSGDTHSRDTTTAIQFQNTSITRQRSLCPPVGSPYSYRQATTDLAFCLSTLSHKWSLATAKRFYLASLTEHDAFQRHPCWPCTRSLSHFSAEQLPIAWMHHLSLHSPAGEHWRRFQFGLL